MRRAALVAVLVTLTGCSLGPRQRDPAPSPSSSPAGSNVPVPPPDVFAIPDAVPRVEPRARRGNPPFYEVFGKRYHVLASSEGHVERGTASWYGPGFHAASTSMGEPYDMYAMTAAHKTLPLPAYAEVTNLRNGRKVIVRINDRGPFVGDRIIDLSYTAAAKLDMLRAGTAPVEVRVISAQAPHVAAAQNAPVAAPATALPPPAIAPPAIAPPAVAAPSATPPPGDAMYIQAGVFADHENARRRLESLLAAGIELASLDELQRDGRALHRVRVGPLASVEEFDLRMRRLRELGIEDARLATD